MEIRGFRMMLHITLPFSSMGEILHLVFDGPQPPGLVETGVRAKGQREEADAQRHYRHRQERKAPALQPQRVRVACRNPVLGF